MPPAPRSRHTPTRRSSGETREHVLAIAADLFYVDGIQATGVDAIAARADVAPMTLYRLFPSKHDLVAAYVERCSQRYQAMLTAATSPAAGTPHERILAVFDCFDEEIRSGLCRGCPFLLVLAEYPDPDRSAHAGAVAHKLWLRRLFLGLVLELSSVAALRDPDLLAEQLSLVAEGVYGSVQALGPSGPAAHGRATAQALINSMSQHLNQETST